MSNFNINTFKNIVALKKEAPIIGSIAAGIIIGTCLLMVVMPKVTNADYSNITYASFVAKEETKKTSQETQKVVKEIPVVLTAYSSTPDQTDDTPFITASGKMVADGIIANNMLPFGTKVRIPELFGDKVFVVEDRKNARYDGTWVDIWMESRHLAIDFGVRKATLEVLEN
jgi:3D (Asp-Asp-Asp) domain-containing protein